jgi:putative ABC transport system permease protein
LVALAVKKFPILLAPSVIPRLSQVSLDFRVLAFALLVTLICGILVGLIPALRILGFDLAATLRAENTRNAASHLRSTGRK